MAHLNENEHALHADPYDWSVNDVVANLCNPQSALRKVFASLSFPPDAHLAGGFRQHDVTGLALLRDVDRATLREDFGIYSMGHRASLLEVIDVLRVASTKLQQSDASKRSSVGSPSLTTKCSTFHSPGPKRGMEPWHLAPDVHSNGQFSDQGIAAQPFHPMRTPSPLYNPANALMAALKGSPVSSLYGNKIYTATRLQEPSISNIASAFTPENSTGESHRAHLNQGGEDVEDRDLHQDLPSTVTMFPSLRLRQITANQAQRLNEMRNVTAGSEQVASSSGPTVPEPRDHINEHALDSVSDPPDQLPKPGTPYRDEKGRKRMMPVQLSSSGLGTATLLSAELEPQKATPKANTLTTNPEHQVKDSSYGRKAFRKADQVYLGPQALHVDEILLGSAKLNEVIPHESINIKDDFSFSNTRRISSGQSLYVNKLMKFYLRQKPFRLPANSRGDLIGKIPYQEELIRSHYPASMIVISQERDLGYVARRRDRRDGVLDTIHHRQDQLPTPGLFDVAILPTAVDTAHDVEWKCLEKWNHLEGDDVPLPIYGESGSEGEYDSDTWKEMDLEEAERAAESVQLGRKPKWPLEKNMMLKILDRNEQRMTDEWKSKWLPRLEAQAHSIWTRAKRDESFEKQLVAIDNTLVNLNNRLIKYRKELLAVGFSSEPKLLAASKILFQTVADIQECHWQKGVLQRTVAPERPAKIIKPVKRTGDIQTEAVDPSLTTGNGEKASEPENSGDEDSMCDFVVDDVSEAQENSVPEILADNIAKAAEIDHGIGSGRPCSPTTDPESTRNVSTIRSNAPDKPASPIPTVAPDTIDLTQTAKDHAKSVPGLHDSRDSAEQGKGQDPPSERGTSDAVEVTQGQQSPTKSVPSTPSYKAGAREPSKPRIKSPQTPVKVRPSRPSFDDVHAISKMDGLKLVEDLDRRRLLIWTISRTLWNFRKMAFTAINDTNKERLQELVSKGLKAWKARREYINGVSDVISQGAVQVSAWFVAYTIPVRLSRKGFLPGDLDRSMDHLDDFKVFYRFLLDAKKHYDERDRQDTGLQRSPQRRSNTSSLAKAGDAQGSSSAVPAGAVEKQKRRRIERDVLDSASKAISSRRHRVYELEINPQTLELRKQAHERVHADQERRRRELAANASQCSVAYSTGDIIVNPGKSDLQGLVKLDPDFGNGLRLKAHQIEGLQFLWREITADHEAPTGCLLAQPMGLGKSAQIVALLVALAQARASADELVINQVPESLKAPFTMILCPPSLIDNWEDELLRWIPVSRKDILGKIHKVTAEIPMQYRIIELQAWTRAGGVMLIPYSIFTAFVLNRDNKKAVLTEDLHKRLRTILVDDARLVVADEAHAFKTPNTSVRRAVNQLKSRSRIAITGSPLSNNLGEYYELVDWVAPKYLGTPAEFRYQFEEPISHGLYAESSDADHHLAMRRLKMLQLDLEPKVHRADFDILHKQLYGKEEFLIRVPMTDIQRDLYQIYVTLITTSLLKTTNLAKTFGCLNHLKLICHHPKLYSDWLVETQAPPHRIVTIADNQELEGAPGTIYDYDILGSARKAIIERSQKVLAGLSDVDAPGLSDKVSVTLEIVKLGLSAGDKILIFSHRPGSLQYIAQQLRTFIAPALNMHITQIYGSTRTNDRQRITTDFNQGSANVCLITTEAGGIGLNLFGANRVVILDEFFNPMHEQQAIGRSYRIGQKKKVYVYRLATAGTYEDILQQQGVFKTQLAARVVDQKNLVRSGNKTSGTYIFSPRNEPQKSTEEFVGKDPKVLDKILNSFKSSIVSVTSVESFQKEDDVRLSAKEEELVKVEQLYYRKPSKYKELLESGEIASLPAGGKMSHSRSHSGPKDANTQLSPLTMKPASSKGPYVSPYRSPSGPSIIGKSMSARPDTASPKAPLVSPHTQVGSAKKMGRDPPTGPATSNSTNAATSPRKQSGGATTIRGDTSNESNSVATKAAPTSPHMQRRRADNITAAITSKSINRNLALASSHEQLGGAEGIGQEKSIVPDIANRLDLVWKKISIPSSLENDVPSTPTAHPRANSLGPPLTFGTPSNGIRDVQRSKSGSPHIGRP